jgi:hypothetical protein
VKQPWGVRMAGDALVSRRLVAGGPGDFLAAHHLVLRGSHEEIGVALDREVQAHFTGAEDARDERISAARLAWFAARWPEHHRRLLGIAAERRLRAPAADQAADLGCVPHALGCSVVYCPPDVGTDGHARVGRNYDFFTGSVAEMFSIPTELPQPAMTSRPYIVSTTPDTGRAVTCVAAYELSGCLEGMNDAGLVIATLADDETGAARGTGVAKVGVDELQLPLLVLEQCRTAAQAHSLLNHVEHYTRMMPCHYLVADAAGHSFVFEIDELGLRHVVDGHGSAQVVTNHLLHRYDGVDDLPDCEPAVRDGLIPAYAGTYERARSLSHCIEKTLVSEDDLGAALDAVCLDGRVAGGRTLWRTIFDLTDVTMTVEFYLGDQPDGRPRRSDPVTVGGLRSSV